MKGVREPRDAQLHFVVAKLGTHELDSLVVMAVSSLDKFNNLILCFFGTIFLIMFS